MQNKWTRVALGSLAMLGLDGCAVQPATPESAATVNTQSISSPALDRPNIIFITAEDLSPRFGSFGDSAARTPNIDALAKDGIRYPNSFTTAGVCAPSRSALITGVHQQTLGTMHMRTTSFGKDMPYGKPYHAVPPAEVKAFPELLRAAGYYTVNRNKTDYQMGDPFTIWDEDAPNAQWKNRKPGQPFFAMINFGQTHESITWPLDTRGDHPSIPGVMKKNAGIDAKKNFERTNPADVTVPPYYPDTPNVRANIARHYDNIRVMDMLVGKLLDDLKSAGRFEDSIIIFSTDHGDGLPRAKRTIYDSGLKVPIIIRYPDKRGAGSINTELVSFVDIAPTFLSFAGAKIPDWIQGRDISGAHQEREYIYASADRFDETYQRRKAVRDDRYSFIRNYLTDQPVLPSLRYQNINPIMREWRQLDKKGGLNDLQKSYLHGPLPDEELYDVVADPFQVTNLAADPEYSTVLKRMRGAMQDWLARTGDLSALDERELRNRMWPGGTQPVTAAPAACLTKSNRVQLVSATSGASLGWRNGNEKWELYSAPLSADRPFAAKAIRYGYKESALAKVAPEKLPNCS